MYTNEQVCQKIRDILPGIGECGNGLDVHYVQDLKVWEVDFERNGHHVRTFLEPDDAERCLDKNECLGLGFQIGQF